MIPVTKPFLPPKHEYNALTDGIWERCLLTNNGPLALQLEQELKNYLNIEHLLFVGNGTVAIQIAIKALGLKGEIITTPFSYVATCSSIVWENCTPVFADIHPQTFNIDPAKIEACITPQTSAILATHVYGNPCDVYAIQRIAEKHNLKVIYDAAHAFGVKVDGKSIFSFGDVSTTSFHATKLFHTIEGGAVFTNDKDVLKRMAYMRNFGHDGPEKFNGVGINGKNSEFHAAMGLCNLKYIESILNARKSQCLLYNELFADAEIQKLNVADNVDFNYAYYPVVFKSEEVALRIKEKLEKNNIHPRRYFYPSLSALNYVAKGNTPVADDVSCRVLCLPLYHALTNNEVEFIAKLIKEDL